MYSFPNFEPDHCSMSGSNCCSLTCKWDSQETGKVVWYSHLFQNFLQFVVIHTVKGFSIVNEAEVDVFLVFSCFLDDPTDFGNLISGSLPFSKSTLNIWKFSIHVLLKSSLKDFEHYLASMWNEHILHGSLNILWHCLSLELKWKMTFSSSGKHCWVFQICWHIECSTLTASSFRISNSSAGIPSPPLAMFVVMITEAHLTS